jgi:hypothetical protein
VLLDMLTADSTVNFSHSIDRRYTLINGLTKKASFAMNIIR